MVEIPVYNGRHLITFEESTHKYRVDSMPIKGVTTIIGSVLAKNGLMLWPLNKAIEYIRTYCNNGRVGVYELDDSDLEKASKEHVVARDSGANTGTTVHKLAESILRGEQIDLLDYPEEVIRAINGFEHWLANNDPEVIAVEQIVYSRDSDYVGTLDSIIRLDNKNYICDLKTTNVSKDAPLGIYPENFVQLGGYAKAYLEEFENENEEGITDTLVPIDDLMIISAKKDGKVDVLRASDVGLTVKDCIHMWECVHDLYVTLEKLKKILGNKHVT